MPTAKAPVSSASFKEVKVRCLSRQGFTMRIEEG